MILLLDTNAFLWFIAGNPLLSESARKAIEANGNLKNVSVVSLWEIAIKVSIGKLILSAPFEQLFPQQIFANGFDLIPIKVEHLSAVINLPFHHRDPFDRLLIAQAAAENFSIISSDAIFDSYSCKRVW
jgi:PIN domain nuclease of toxin-antitoxin system